MELSYVIGKLFFTDTPKVYNKGSILEGKVSERKGLHFSFRNTTEAMCILSDAYFFFAFRQVKAVYFNNTPIPDKLVHLLDVESWSGRLLQNLTTNSDGIATFSLNTTGHKGDIQLRVSE